MNIKRNSRTAARIVNVVALLIALAAEVTRLEAGNYTDVYGAHPAANAMGNAVVSFVSDASAVYYNPAGLGQLSAGDLIVASLEAEGIYRYGKGTPSESARDTHRPSEPLHEVVLFYNYSAPELRTTAPLNQDIEGVRDDFAGLGLTLNLNSIFDIGRVFRFGLNIYAPATGNLITINDLNPTAHRYLQHGVSNQKPTIMGGLGIEVIKDMLFAGVGFNTTLKGKGAMLLKDVPIANEQVVPNQQAILELKGGFEPTYGLQFKYKKFMAGVSYRSESYVGIDSLSARAQTLLLGIQLDFDLALLDHYSPPTWTYGFAWQFSEKFQAAVDISRELWGAWAEHRTELSRLSGNAPLARTKLTYSEDYFLDDTTNVHAGVRYIWTNWLALRAGVAKRPSPLPVQGGSANWMDNDRMAYTLGTSLTLRPSGGRLKSPIILDIVAEMQTLKERRLIKISPTNRQPHYYTHGGRIIHWGFSTTMFF